MAEQKSGVSKIGGVDDKEKDWGQQSIPVDYSFHKVRYLQDLNGAPRSIRVGTAPKNRSSGKYISCSLWLNNNSLETLSSIYAFVESVFEYPDKIQWIDLSFNNLEDFHEDLMKFKELRILYVHGNCIGNFHEIAKLRPLKRLITLTLQGCPIELQPLYRQTVIFLLPQLKNLDFVTISPQEINAPAPPGARAYIE